MRFVRLVPVGICVCVLALTACGGGGGDGGGGGSSAVTAEEYASSVCASVDLWRERLEEGSTILMQRMNVAKSLRKVRTDFVRFFGGAIEQTDAMLAEVRAVGAPDLEQGSSLAGELVKRLQRFRPLLVAARSDAQRLPLADEEKFTIGAQTLAIPFGREIARLPGVLAELAGRYDAPELTEAAAAVPACASL
jgi:hypothetical protein